MHELALYGMLGCEILLLKMADMNCLLCRRLWSEQAEYSGCEMVHDVEMMLVFIPI